MEGCKRSDPVLYRELLERNRERFEAHLAETPYGRGDPYVKRRSAKHGRCLCGAALQKGCALCLKCRDALLQAEAAWRMGMLWPDGGMGT